MTDRPYTDEDLRAEAGRALSALVHLPTVEEIVASLRQSYIPHLHADGDLVTWGSVLDEDELAEAARQIAERMIPAAPVGEWAVNLGADGLEPTAHVINLDSPDGPFVRLHLAIHPDMPEADRLRLHKGMRHAIITAVGEPDEDEEVDELGDSDGDVLDLIAEIASRLRDATDEGEYHAVGLVYDLASGRTTCAEARRDLADITLRHV
ncbi:hypothetical protein AB0912_15420 [Streptomyces sp. NPDC007084]|uniref:hypothetical protein n=1 Tax=Streptomyces sp. NPDC007084 TaxID=3154313 RepID=UPI0034558FB2